MKKESLNEDALAGARKICKCARGTRKTHGCHYHCQFCNLSYRNTGSLLHHETKVHNNMKGAECSASTASNTPNYKTQDITAASEPVTGISMTDVSLCDGVDIMTDLPNIEETANNKTIKSETVDSFVSSVECKFAAFICVML